MRRMLAVVWLLGASMAMAREGDAPAAPYGVELQGKATYDASGQHSPRALGEAESYPAAFLAHVQAQLRQKPIDPRLADGVPATFDTAVRVRITITPKPGGADARIDGIGHGPGIVRRGNVLYPRDLSAVDGWKGSVVAHCVVDIAGRCGPVDIVNEAPGMPDSARKFAKDSLARWQFEPQRVGGKPITSEFTTTFNLETRNSLPPRKFGK